MTFLRQSCERAQGLKRHPRMPERLSTERVERELAGLQPGVRRDPEPWKLFLKRLNLEEPSSLRPRELKRLVDEMWAEDQLEAASRNILDEAVARNRKSFDRTIIHTYLARFPSAHSSFPALTAASSFVARRHDWPWANRGERWSLWDPREGPDKVAGALLGGADPMDILREAGLDGELTAGEFVKDALISGCKLAAVNRKQAAEESGERLIRLFAVAPGSGELNGLLAYALLSPWISDSCSADHQKRVSALLVHRVGDPRLAGARWAAMRSNALKFAPDADVDSAFSVLRRWLVQATVRQFFSVVAQTTDRKDQWKARTEFWLGYLDAGVITEAWFAFGSMAERLARKLLDDDTIPYGRIEGGGADSSHSALVFTLGDLRIAEWSHNGRARFWHVADHNAPALYEKSYNGLALRTMHAGKGFEALAHTGGWQASFARHIYRETGVRHPRHGAGW